MATDRLADHAELSSLLDAGLLWRGRRGEGRARHLPTGFDELDALIGGGWPASALVELISADHLGLALLLPALQRLQSGWLAWVDPPWQPHAAALAARGVAVERLLLVRGGDESLWALEQLLRSGQCAAVLSWPPRLADRGLRRLQLAAEEGDTLGILFRPPAARAQPSPAALRLSLEPHPRGLRVEVLKRRGGWGGQGVVLCTG